MLPVLLYSVSKSYFRFHSNVQLLCGPQDHDYDMAITIKIVIVSYASQDSAWPLGRLVSCRFFFFFSGILRV